MLSVEKRPGQYEHSSLNLSLRCVNLDPCSGHQEPPSGTRNQPPRHLDTGTTGILEWSKYLTQAIRRFCQLIGAPRAEACRKQSPPSRTNDTLPKIRPTTK
jgi:hypothetical protein